MKLPNDSFRGWMIPAVLVATATLLTVPWSYWVIKAAYDRDVLDNANNLARRVEMRMLLSEAASNAPQQTSDVLATELALDSTVQTAAFFDLRNPKHPLGWTRLPGTREPSFSAGEIRRHITSGVLIEQSGDRYSITLPWVLENRALGFTYLEFSRALMAAHSCRA